MPKLLLTQHAVDTLQCPLNKKRIDYFDTRLQGLILKISLSGRKSYYVRYTDHYNRTKERRFANAAISSLSDARTKAKELLSKIELGEDPFIAKALKKEIPLYSDYIFTRYLPYMKTHKRSWSVDEAMLRLHILPILGKLPVDCINRQHAYELLRSHHSQGFKPSSTNRMLNVAHRTFSCALEWEINGVESNPISSIKRLKENNLRDRFLSNNELKNLLSALDTFEHPKIREIIKMLILTGARRNEVLVAKWSDIDFQNLIWRIEVNKSGMTRYVPLFTGAVSLLNTIERRFDVDYIFYNPLTLKPYVNIYHPWNQVREIAGIPDIRLHDLRHSYASFLVNQGRTIYEVQKILGHSSVKTTQRYAHLSNETLLEATNTVSTYVTEISNKKLNSPAYLPA